ncbi:MAG TPA: SDR family oxidoreductase, partial [Burkholderiaceae bacterium]|nr:SDR family oxidoreductase [Burkholderiaceae bacterium]
MHLAPTEIDPSRQVHAEALGKAERHGRLRGRRIVVVGAGQRPIPEAEPPVGNGRAISLLFAREGASLACVDISREAVEATCASVEAEGGKAVSELADVSDPAALAPLIARCADRLGGLDAGQGAVADQVL